MNRGKQTSTPHTGGYTIVEVLIFLAVSSLMVFLAIIFIGGQQNKAEFTSAVRDFETRITDIANDVATGYYIKPVNFACNASGGRPNPHDSGGVDTQGQNDECVFAGTVVKFGDPQTTERQAYMQFAMAGLRTTSSGANVSTLEEADPVPIYHPSNAMRDAVAIYQIGYAAEVRCVAFGATNCTPGNNNAAIGFYSTFRGASATGQGSGIQTDVMPYDSVSLTDNRQSTAAKLGQPIDITRLNPDGVVICLESGGSGQYALVRLGSASGGLTVTSEVKNTSGGNLCT